MCVTHGVAIGRPATPRNPVADNGRAWSHLLPPVHSTRQAVAFNLHANVDTSGHQRQAVTQALQELHQLQTSCRAQDPPFDEAIDGLVDVLSGSDLEGQASDHP